MVKPNGSQVILKKNFCYGFNEFDKGMILTLWDKYYYSKCDVAMFQMCSFMEVPKHLLTDEGRKYQELNPEVFELIKKIRIPVETVKNLSKVFEDLDTNPITNLENKNILN